jgi:perosamine synthetase
MNIFISLSPNVEREDRQRAWRLLWRPWRWKRGNAIALVEGWFRDQFRVAHAWSTNSGRSALIVILDALGVGKGDEVLLQAFTCNAVPNPILWAGAKPVYVDIDVESLTMKPDDLEKKITVKTKAVIVQHTFGYPADMKRIMHIAKKHSIRVIEDHAHSIEPKNSFRGDVAFFSFGRDKVISSVYGGMIITHNDALAEKITARYERLAHPGLFWIKQQLLHPIVMELVMRTYNWFGKYLLVALQRLHFLSMAVSTRERMARKPRYFPARLPNAHAALAYGQLQRVERFSAHRRQMAAAYDAILPKKIERPQRSNTDWTPLRYTIHVTDPERVLLNARQHGVFLGDWYMSIITPATTNTQAMKYKEGSCNVAEQVTQTVLNLPTHIRLTTADIQRVVDSIREIP